MGNYLFSEEELKSLKKKDKKLSKAIDEIGEIKREINPDLFESLVNNIVGQQISMKAQDTIWKRFLDHFLEITPEKIFNASIEEIQSLGISTRKATYIHKAAEKVHNGELDIHKLLEMNDEDVCTTLVSLDGIGLWTAEMLMIFSMGRKDILSFGDLAIKRGMINLYGHKEITKERFEKYRKRYSPHGTLASMYLWELSKDIYK